MTVVDFFRAIEEHLIENQLRQKHSEDIFDAYQTYDKVGLSLHGYRVKIPK